MPFRCYRVEFERYVSVPRCILVVMGANAFGAGLLDLILPRECGGCGCLGTLWCRSCSALFDDVPIELNPRVDPGVPVWALGRYVGPRRRSIIAMKERGRRDLVSTLGSALAHATATLERWGELDSTSTRGLVLVPAPSRRRAARARGGDPVRAMAETVRRAYGPSSGVLVSPILCMGAGVRDSVGLNAAGRVENVHGRIAVSRRDFVAAGRSWARGSHARGAVPERPSVILLDDVLTSGATAAESVRTLSNNGIRTTAVLVLAGA